MAVHDGVLGNGRKIQLSPSFPLRFRIVALWSIIGSRCKLYFDFRWYCGRVKQLTYLNIHESLLITFVCPCDPCAVCHRCGLPACMLIWTGHKETHTRSQFP